MLVACNNCHGQNQVPNTPPPEGQRYRCGHCGAFLPSGGTGGGGDMATKTVAGVTGGALLGWSIGGPPGAIVGGIIGALIGANAGGRNG